MASVEEQPFRIIALAPAGVPAPGLVVAADHAGCLGLLNAELGSLPVAALEQLSGRTKRPFGLKLNRLDTKALTVVEAFAPRGLGWLMLDAAYVLDNPEVLGTLADLDVKVVVEATEWDERLIELTGHVALQVKGHEAGGRVGEETSFILLQKALRASVLAGFRARRHRHALGRRRARPPAAAGWCSTISCLLLKESPVAETMRAQLGNFTGLETGVLSAGGTWRVFEKPGFRHLRQLKARLADPPADAAVDELSRAISAGPIRPTGRAARPGRRLRRSICRALRHVRPAGTGAPPGDRPAPRPGGRARPARARDAASPPRTGRRSPIVQGPMTRVSDVAGFAQAVAEAGALPLLALALMRPEQVDALLAETDGSGLPASPGASVFSASSPAELIHAQTRGRPEARAAFRDDRRRTARPGARRSKRTASRPICTCRRRGC